MATALPVAVDPAAFLMQVVEPFVEYVSHEIILPFS
jgi:hypothetical protein